MQHAGQLDVVDVPAAPAHEARVLLAQHPAVPDRLLVVVVERVRTFVHRGHAGLPAVVTAPAESLSSDLASFARSPASWTAAQRTERTIVE